MPTEYVRDSSGHTYTLVRQSDPTYCGLASVAAVIIARSRTCLVHPPTEQQLLAEAGGTMPPGGLRRSQLAQLLTLHNIPNSMESFGDSSTFIPALRSKIKAGHPAILHAMRGGPAGYAGHWVVAVDTADDILTVLDPMYGLQEVSFDFLPSYPFVQRGARPGAAAGVVFSGQCIFT